MAKTLEQWFGQPYGIWTCADGRQVIFNRRYKPMWQRLLDGRVVLADPTEWVHWRQQDWFYDDGTPTREVKHRGRVEVMGTGSRQSQASRQRR